MSRRGRTAWLGGGDRAWLLVTRDTVYGFVGLHEKVRRGDIAILGGMAWYG